MESFFVDSFEKNLLKRHQTQFRSLFPQDTSNILNFSSLDFLHLTPLPYVKQQALNHLLRFGVGPLPSRPIEEFEKEKRTSESKLAELLGHETASFFEPTTASFPRLLQTLITPNTVVIKHKHFAYPPTHPVETKILESNNELAIKHILSAIGKNRHILILLESLSSRTGKIEPIDAIISATKKYNTTIVVDDTYSIQVLGKHGMGLSAGKKGVDIILGNFGKAFGFSASYISSSKSLMDYLLNDRSSIKCRVTPLLLGIIDATLDLIPSMKIERDRILETAKKFRKMLEICGFDKSPSDSHLIAIPFKTPSDMRSFNLHLAENACIPNSINTPNIKDKPLITRFFISSSHNVGHLSRLQEVLSSSRQQILCEAL